MDTLLAIILFFIFTLGEFIDTFIEDYIKPFLDSLPIMILLLVLIVLFVLLMVLVSVIVHALMAFLPLFIEWIMTILRDPAWQGFGAIVGVLALIVAMASMKKPGE